MIRGRPPLQRPDTIGPVELALVILVPAVPSAVFGQWGDAVQTMFEGVVVLLAVWALTSYGVLPLLAWAGAGHVVAASGVPQPDRPSVAAAAAVHDVPVRQRRGLGGRRHAHRADLLRRPGRVLHPRQLLPALPSAGVDALAQNTFASWTEVTDLVDELASCPTTSSIGSPATLMTCRPSTGRRCANGSTSGSLPCSPRRSRSPPRRSAMFGFFVLFGFLAISADIAAGWTGGPVHVLAEVTVGGRTLVVSEPLASCRRLPRRLRRDVLHRGAVHRLDLPRGVRRGHRAGAAAGAGGAPAVSASAPGAS